METRANLKTNLLTGQFTTNKLGLAYLFAAVIGLALSLIAAASLGFISHAQYQAKIESAKKSFRAASVTSMVSNEKANPGTIGAYLNDTFAGALTDDGAFSPTAQTPPEGPLVLLFINPTGTQLPTNAEFQTQTISLKADTGDLTICTPTITGGKMLWVSKSGSTFYDQYLTQPARSC